MSYHITANYDDMFNDYVCDTYQLGLDDIFFYKRLPDGSVQETGTVSFRNPRFIGLDIEKIEGVH